MLERFDKNRFMAASHADRLRLCAELAADISSRLQGKESFHCEVIGMVEELRSLGHDLWSYDEDDDFEVWGPNYHVSSGPGLVITFAIDRVEVSWAQQ
ncbi:MAG TPA: hypothetical protein VLT87_07235 [Thermoanaerobaculia bacterium]|nr:hypothetical protein [Thermoanaerobaculia bacterium]